MATAAVTHGAASPDYGVRWYADDNADPDSMTALATQQASATEGSFSRQTGTANRLVGRVLMQNSSAALWNSAINWEYRRKPFGGSFGGWTTLNASSSYIRTTGGTPAADANVSVSILSGGSGTFEDGTLGGGTFNEDDGVPVDPGIAKNNFSEWPVCVYLVDADVNDGDVLQIRLTGAAVTTELYYPTLTVSKATPDERIYGVARVTSHPVYRM